MAVRPPRPNGLPSASLISKSPSTRMEPLELIVIFAGIASILAEMVADAIINPNAYSADPFRRGAIAAGAAGQSVASHSGKNDRGPSSAAELHLYRNDRTQPSRI